MIVFMSCIFISYILLKYFQTKIKRKQTLKMRVDAESERNALLLA